MQSRRMCWKVKIKPGHAKKVVKWNQAVLQWVIQYRDAVTVDKLTACTAVRRPYHVLLFLFATLAIIFFSLIYSPRHFQPVQASSDPVHWITHCKTAGFHLTTFLPETHCILPLCIGISIAKYFQHAFEYPLQCLNTPL